MEGQYPLDFDALDKGQLLGLEYLEQVTGVSPRNDKEFKLRCLGIKSLIEARRGFTCQVTYDGIRILTDEDAAAYNPKRFNGHIRGLKNRLDLNLEVDRSRLSIETKDRHERNLINQSRIYQAVSNEVRSIAIGPPETRPLRLTECEE